MSREFKERIECTNRYGMRFEVEVFDYAPVQNGTEFAEQSAGLPDSSAVLVVADQPYSLLQTVCSAWAGAMKS